ncbi:MAG: Gfo/Idh/MocA family oxidoreductase [Armatimonadetes bacterium]|nr:Gfo/Idh/MocA family oxidoreductase [Armatimonadota bacterium]
MAAEQLGIGLVGCGDIAPAHAKALAQADSARLVACMDVVASSAKTLADEYGVPHTTDLAELLARPDLDAVTVATPAFTHAGIVEQAAKAGKAVLCEKPLAADLPDADRIIDACRTAGVALATCVPLRNLGAAKWTRELIQSGALGDVIAIRLRNLGEKHDPYWTGGYSGRTATDWRKSKTQSGGGVIITNLSHHLDLARAMTGLEVVSVYGQTGTFATDVEVEDVGVACLRYDNGAIGTLEGSSCYYGDTPEPGIVVLAAKGQSRFRLWGGACDVYLTEAAADLPAREWTTRTFEDSIQVEVYDEFAAAIREGRPPSGTGEDGRKALEIAVAIYRSARIGQPVSLPL